MDGSEKEVKSYQPGEYFGELALLRNEPRAANIIAKVFNSLSFINLLERRNCFKLRSP